MHLNDSLFIIKLSIGKMFHTRPLNIYSLSNRILGKIYRGFSLVKLLPLMLGFLSRSGMTDGGALYEFSILSVLSATTTELEAVSGNINSFPPSP